MNHFTQVHDKVEHLFRHEASRITSWLVKRFGTDHLELIEDAVQHSLLRAMQTWPFREIPGNPSGWILRTANNFMIDRFRKQQKVVREKVSFNNEKEDAVIMDKLDDELKDDLLAMMFACCHPLLSEENQIILSLKILFSFSNREVARALMKSEDAVAKSFTRAKQKFKDKISRLEIPLGKDLNNRLDVILKIFYLLFNEGYNSVSDDKLIRKDLCEEAIRLTKLILENSLLRKPKVHALISLMYFQSSRFEARIGGEGEMLTLDQQDRSRWNREYIQKGLDHMQISYAFGIISAYHVEASIAAYHALAPDFKKTDWESIFHAYRVLEKMKGGSIVRLNKIVAESYFLGPEQAYKSLSKLEQEKNLSGLYLYDSVKGSLFERMGKKKEAIEYFGKALQKTSNQVEKDFLDKKIKSLQ